MRQQGAVPADIDPAEREQDVVTLSPGASQVVLELAPLVSRDLRADQVVAFEVEAHPGPGEPAVGQLFQR
jgi:hypothetical protein